MQIWKTNAEGETLYNNQQRNYHLPIKPQRYLHIWYYWSENGDTTDADAMLWSATSTGVVVGLFRENTAPIGVDLRLDNAQETGSHRVSIASLALANTGEESLCVSIDMSNINSISSFKSWLNGVSQSPSTRSNTTSANDPGWAHSYASTICRVGFGSIDNNEYAFGRQDMGCAIYSAPYPMTQTLADDFGAFKINPFDLPQAKPFMVTDFNQWPMYNYANKKVASLNNRLKIQTKKIFPGYLGNYAYNIIPGIHSEDVAPPNVVRVR